MTSIADFCPEMITNNGDLPSNWEDIEWNEETQAPQAIEPIVSATMEILVEIKNVVLPKVEPAKRAMTLEEYRAECDRKRRETSEKQAAEKLAAEEASIPASTRRNRRKKELAKARKNNALESKKNTEWNETKKTIKEKLIYKPIRKSQKVPPEIKDDTGATSGFVNTTLILKNLPYDCTENELHKFFNKCGPVRFVNLVKKETEDPKDGSVYRNCIAFVRFVNRDGSNKGLEMDGFTYAGRTIYVDYALDRREKQ